MIELSTKETMPVKIDGTQYNLKKPSLKMIDAFQAETKGKESDDIKPTIAFLDMVGLPSVVAMDLDAKSVQLIFEMLSGVKKN